MKKIIALMILSSLVFLTSCGETEETTDTTGTGTEIADTNTWTIIEDEEATDETEATDENEATEIEDEEVTDEVK